MWEAFAKIAAAWLAEPKRVMGTIVVGALLFFALFQVAQFSAAIKDPILRWPTLLLLVASSFFVTFPLGLAGKTLAAKRENWKRLSRLKDLTAHEKKVLSKYLENESTVEAWDRGGGAVNVLARDGILSLITSDPDDRNLLPDSYAIDATVWKHLKKHPDLLKI
jgi:hypothetical protein